VTCQSQAKRQADPSQEFQTIRLRSCRVDFLRLSPPGLLPAFFTRPTAKNPEQAFICPGNPV